MYFARNVNTVSWTATCSLCARHTHINFLPSLTLAIETKFLQRKTCARPSISNNTQAIEDSDYGYTRGMAGQQHETRCVGKFRLSVLSKFSTDLELRARPSLLVKQLHIGERGLDNLAGNTGFLPVFTEARHRHFCPLSILMLAFHLRLGLPRYFLLSVCSTSHSWELFISLEN
jgi:hypothetical protein